MDLPGKNSPRRGIVAVILAAADRIVKVNLAHTAIFPALDIRVDAGALSHAEKVHAAFGANHVARRWRDPVSRRPHRLRALIPPAGWRRPKRTPPADSANTPIEDTDKTNSHIDMRMPEV